MRFLRSLISCASALVASAFSHGSSSAFVLPVVPVHRQRVERRKQRQEHGTPRYVISLKDRPGLNQRQLRKRRRQRSAAGLRSAFA